VKDEDSELETQINNLIAEVERMVAEVRAQGGNRQQGRLHLTKRDPIADEWSEEDD
jgi:hypothetical protein